MLEVCIVGFGAVGALYGFLIERSGKARVTAVCRSNYELVKSRGVDIRSEKFGDHDAWHPFRVVKTAADAADQLYDYVICAAKYIPDFIPTPRILEPLLTKSSTFVLLQNGIGLHEDLRRALPIATIISVCVWVDATAVDGGNVIRHGRIDRLHMGIHWPTEPPDDTIKSQSQERINKLVDVLVTGGSEALVADNIEYERWRKNLWNVGYSVYCTLTRADVAMLLTDKWKPSTMRIVREFIDEAIGTARAAGLPITDSAIAFVEESTLLDYAETHPERATIPMSKYKFKPSMLVDLEAGRPIEVEGIVGGVVKRAREIGFPVPRLETAYVMLSLLQESLILGQKTASG